MTGLLQQVGVDDDAVGLVAVADGAQLAVRGVHVVGVGVQFLGNGGVRQVGNVAGPLLQTGRVDDNEEGGGSGLAQLGRELLLVGAGGGGHDLDLDTGLLFVHLGDLLEGFVGFGLEVQPVDGTLAGAAAGGKQAHNDCEHQRESEILLFHTVPPKNVVLFGNGSKPCIYYKPQFL